MILSKILTRTEIQSIFKDVLPLIEKFAPSLAGVLAGPYGLIATAVIGILETAFGKAGVPLTPLGIADLIKSTPTAQTTLQNLEATHGAWVTSLQEGVVSGLNSLSTAEINVKLTWDTDKAN